MNNVNLVGRLTRDPELTYTGNGIAVASFRLAVDRPIANKSEQTVDFIDIVAWRGQAEFVANYLEKGRLVSIKGRLQVRDWKAQDGTPRRAYEVVSEDLRALDSPNGRTSAEQEVEESRPTSRQATQRRGNQSYGKSASRGGNAGSKNARYGGTAVMTRPTDDDLNDPFIDPEY